MGYCQEKDIVLYCIYNDIARITMIVFDKLWEILDCELSDIAQFISDK